MSANLEKRKRNREIPRHLLFGGGLHGTVDPQGQDLRCPLAKLKRRPGHGASRHRQQGEAVVFRLLQDRPQIAAFRAQKLIDVTEDDPVCLIALASERRELIAEHVLREIAFGKGEPHDTAGL